MDPFVDWTLRLGWILPVWLFALGGAIGSFVNVVAYRIPAGKSIVHPGSCCPSCGHPIRWYHNLPIVSWFLLRGRCHDCRARISPRYPLVEFIMAALFAVVFLANVRPQIARLAESGAAGVPGYDVYIRYAGDLWLLATLLCAALVEYDGLRAPRRIFWTAIGVGLMAAALFPAARHATDAPSLDLAARCWAAWEIGLLIAAVGATIGAVGGWLLDRALDLAIARSPKSGRQAGGHSAPLALAGVGAFLGWGAAAAVGMAVGVCAAIAAVMARRNSRPAGGIARWRVSAFALIFTLAWILAAGQLGASLPLTPGP